MYAPTTPLSREGHIMGTHRSTRSLMRPVAIPSHLWKPTCQDTQYNWNEHFFHCFTTPGISFHWIETPSCAALHGKVIFFLDTYVGDYFCGISNDHSAIHLSSSIASRGPDFDLGPSMDPQKVNQQWWVGFWAIYKNGVRFVWAGGAAW
jgi:hypothetical protein